MGGNSAKKLGWERENSGENSGKFGRIWAENWKIRGNLGWKGENSGEFGLENGKFGLKSREFGSPCPGHRDVPVSPLAVSEGTLTINPDPELLTNYSLIIN